MLVWLRNVWCRVFCKNFFDEQSKDGDPAGFQQKTWPAMNVRLRTVGQPKYDDFPFDLWRKSWITKGGSIVISAVLAPVLLAAHGDPHATHDFPLLFQPLDLFEQWSKDVPSSWMQLLNQQAFPHKISSCVAISSSESSSDHQRMSPLKRSDMPLLKRYPGLVSLPHVSLAQSLPTPVYKLTYDEVHDRCYVKRDDLIGHVPSSKKSTDSGTMTSWYGGNKVRKLEFILADALERGAKGVLTFGALGSNFAVATSFYANKLGLGCMCMLTPQVASAHVKQNLLMHSAHDSQVLYAYNARVRMIQALALWLSLSKTYNCPPYLIPVGGSCPLGVVGFVNAFFELQEQVTQGILPEPDHVYVACGSCGTVAGLVLGSKLAGSKIVIHAVLVEPVAESAMCSKMCELVQQTNQLLHEYDCSVPIVDILPSDFVIESSFGGERYGKPSPEGTCAKENANQQSLVLDDTYTSKAYAAFLSDMRRDDMRDKVLLYWHTFDDYHYAETKNILWDEVPEGMRADCVLSESSC